MLIFLGALIGAVIGAGIWAVVTAVTGYEVGIIAWALGGLVGLGGKLAGGRGIGAGILCAVLTLGGIMLGKVFAVNYIVKADAEKYFDEQYTQETFDNFQIAAKEYAKVETEDDKRQFMVQFEFTEEETPDAITQVDIDFFNKYVEIYLYRHNQKPMSYEEWKQANIEDDKELFRKEFDVIAVVVDSLEPIDFLFFVLGVASAFQIVNREEQAQEIC